MNKLIISRSKWRIGRRSVNTKGQGETKLLNEEGYMCCLGFYALQQGIKKEEIFGKRSPQSIYSKTITNLSYKRNGIIHNTVFCSKAMDINDDEATTAKQKEELITRHFAKKGIEVVFKGRYKK